MQPVLEGPITVTPEQAAAWLATGQPEDLRMLKAPHIQTTIEKYRNLMVTGQWRVHPDLYLSFSRTGTLVNGHRRLAACVAADIPFTTFIEKWIA